MRKPDPRVARNPTHICGGAPFGANCMPSRHNAWTRPMKYRKHEAKEYSRAHMRGIFAAANTPFRPGDLALDEAGLRRNMRHWIDKLAIDGLFVAGKQG